MNKIGLNTIMSEIKVYVKENWGSPFIFVFMVLLISTASFLSAGLSSLADAVAVYAYCFLVVGVFLQLACFLKYRKRSDDEVVF